MSNYYKNRRSIEIKVGVFFLLGLAILFLGIFFLQDIYFNGNRSEVIIKFSSTNGLDPGDKVKLHGIDIGKISEIKLIEEGVLVTAIIQVPEFNLSADTYFIASESGLMGGHHLEVIPGSSSQILDLTKVQTGETGVSILAMVGDAKALLTDLSLVMKKVNDNFDVIDSTKVLIHNSDETVKNINSILTSNKKNIEDIVTNLQMTTNNLQTLLASNKNNIDSLLTTMPVTITNLNNNLLELKQVVTKVNSIINAYQSNDNSIKSLIEEKELYDKMIDTIDQADSLIQDIKKNPKKYIDLKIF